MEVKPMPVQRKLELLNKANRTPEEQVELENELRRESMEAMAAQGNDGNKEQSQPGDNAQVEGANVAPVEPAKEEYSLATLKAETQDAINYLKSLDKSEVLDMVIAGYTQALYFLGKAQE